MKRLIASSLAIAAALSAPLALSEPAGRTALVERDGQSVDRMPLLYEFDAVWVVDTQSLLYRDIHPTYYLVTLKAACGQLIYRDFGFFPAWTPQLLASNAYEVRPEAGPHCHVAKIEKVDATRATALRDTARRRAW